MKIRDLLLVVAILLLLWAVLAGTAEAQEAPVEAREGAYGYYLPLVTVNARDTPLTLADECPEVVAAIRIPCQ
jgi:hypothetical protein